MCETKVGFQGVANFHQNWANRCSVPQGDAGLRLGTSKGFKSLGRPGGRAVIRVVLDSRVLRPRPFLRLEQPGALARTGLAAAAGCAGAGRGLGCKARGNRPGGGAGRGGGSWPGQARAAARGAGIQ